MAILEREYKIELQNRQIARFLAGLTAASFLTGAIATFFGLRRR